MATGSYANGGVIDNPVSGTVSSTISGPITVTKTGDGPFGNTDADVLSLGDSFTISGSTDNFVYVGTDGNGGLLASNFSDIGSSIWLTDGSVTIGDSWPNLTLENTTICFAAGTMIATPAGERSVEALQIGEMVTAADGRAVPVTFVGRQSVHKIFTPAEKFVPVRVRAGALGGGLPHSDLVLTADHALILDGLAVNAGALVNGTSIAWEPISALPDCVTYYHVETEAHDVILANGAAAETYVDYVQRRAFANYAEYVALYGEAERTIPEMDMPRVSAARLLPPELRARLAGAAAA